ncbi:hypothetical protein R7D96_22115 [Vibrio sp. Vb2853]|uniref:helix-turn-helix domain-containing protein n=1 Tax=unclassified Vibrio TaxID=2614977 RepID=UPI0023EDFD86|nr:MULTISPECIES: hypothetical protein [unclassified Vibrio]MDF4490324.1 hypothetical protein [Vibrio parahaemolyticus]MDW1616801.1 hypothetical protein [Vibrio sp. Vb2881]MDW1621513.1 hypothetical protein [Vibrio sp. Vb2864]MDW1693676.1 hypothetical protein [Vibrio sp. Vb2853]MDW1712385.1 hypothetical protein [Vibrio sp. Vb2865]
MDKVLGLITCPSCQGNRTSVVFVNTGLDSSQHYSEVRDCDRCSGAGYVPHEVVEAIEKGKQLRKERIDKGFTLRQMATQEGVSVSVISKRELGYI